MEGRGEKAAGADESREDGGEEEDSEFERIWVFGLVAWVLVRLRIERSMGEQLE